jgi:hypothetical protein
MAEGNYRDIDKGSASVNVDCSRVPCLNGAEDHVPSRSFVPFIVGIHYAINRLCDDAQGSNVYFLVMYNVWESTQAVSEPKYISNDT